MLKNSVAKAKVEIIKTFELYEPTSDLYQMKSSLTRKSLGASCIYGKSKTDNFFLECYNHFPLLINPDGSLWTEANRYLLSHLVSVIPVRPRTLESIAGDLKHFRDWLLNENIDFLNITVRPRSRPTYRYCAYLHDELRMHKTQSSTAKRRMSSVQNFYRWLGEDGYEFGYPLWIESDAKYFFQDSHGFQRSKSYKSTDLTRTFKTPKNSNDYSDRIEDGGRLRPLPEDEQVALVESLRAVGNIEMLLSFMFALTTGARLQTVFTLRKSNFAELLPKETDCKRLLIGAGTLVNTKNNKQMVLLVPMWLYKRVQIYINSERYKRRLSWNLNAYKNEDEQYVFLTKAGRPYYMASQDENLSKYRDPPRGNAITQFLLQQLKPYMKECGHNFEFSFHDLRATFGMNLLAGKLLDYKLGGVSTDNQKHFFQLLNYVKERMGHSHHRTTEAYLNYRQKYHLALHVQTEYESYLERLMGQGGNQ
ncbi:MAG: hypothetical protein BVN34_00935 [Proteobacteria bacterium ST_bin12]|nr:MAG: hypothetical protein BVN34_00935 [Proteobacteria bacterium ST_bin12]